MLQPSAEWTWYINQEQACLSLDMGELSFCAAMKMRQLDNVKMKHRAFNLDDSSLYFKYYQAAADELYLADHAALEIALNALAIARFCKMDAAKSWLVNKSWGKLPPKYANFAYVKSKTERGLFLIVQADTRMSIIMLLNSQMTLNSGKILYQFESLRVANDRLGIYTPC